MCGLVGVARLNANGLFLEQKKIFDDLLIADSVRGMDGTGLLAISIKGERKGLKNQGNPFNLIGTKTYEEYTDVNTQPYPIIFAGHNRHATKGGISTKSSHPFYAGNISLMHNGTLRNYNKFPGKFDVDSESFCNAINVMGIDESIANMDGAYAITYYDSKEETFNFARNQERPLYMAINEKLNTIIWASESEMISWALARRSNNSKDFKIESIPANMLFSFDVKKFIVKERKLPLTGSKITSFFSSVHDDIEMDYQELAFQDYKKKHFKLKDIKKDSNGNKNMVETTDKTKAFIIGSELVFDLFEHDDIKGNSLEVPKENLLFSAVGTRDDMKDVEFRFTIKGQDRLFELYAQEHLIGTISSIYVTKDDKGKSITRVWCKDVRFVGEKVK